MKGIVSFLAVPLGFNNILSQKKIQFGIYEHHSKHG